MNTDDNYFDKKVTYGNHATVNIIMWKLKWHLNKTREFDSLAYDINIELLFELCKLQVAI